MRLRNTMRSYFDEIRAQFRNSQENLTLVKGLSFTAFLIKQIKCICHFPLIIFDGRIELSIEYMQFLGKMKELLS